MSRKKGHDEHMDESWLIPYADILTLLLALFIVLFCSSSIDVKKYNSLMESFSREFNMEGAGHFEPDNISELTTPPNPTYGEDEEDGNTSSQVDRLFLSINTYIEGNGLNDEMKIQIMGESLLITLTSDIWFPSGSAVISAEQRETAKKLADMIQNSHSDKRPLNIIITGHTDNVPIKTAQFPSNWYLSATRAINFMEVMLAQSDLDPRIFSARGYGEYEPIDTNETSAGRQRNRRVEMLISFDNTVVTNDNDSDSGGGNANSANSVIQIF